MRLIGRAFAVVVFVSVVASCRVDADVHVTLDEDGSGTVACTITLDVEAVARATGGGQRTLDESIPVADLEAAGWDLNGGWQLSPDGNAVLEVSHDFADAAELEARLGELDGGTIIAGSDVVRERGLFRRRDEVTVDVDMRAVGAQILADEALTASLQAAGLDPAALDEQLSTELVNALEVDVTVEVPGDEERSVVTPGEQQSVAAASSEFDSGRLVLVVIGGIVVFLAVLLYLAASASARRTRRMRSAAPERDRTPLM